MKAKEVFVIYAYENKVIPREINRGALIGTNHVFVIDDEGAALLTCEPTASDRHVLVDFDKEACDVLQGNEHLIIDLMCNTEKWGVRLNAN